MTETQAARRAALEELLVEVQPPLHLTPATRERAIALDWLTRFEGAGLDGVIAKPESGTYLPGKRVMIKVKHARTADCVVAGFRWHKSGRDPSAVGKLMDGAQPLAKGGKLGELEKLVDRALEILGEAEKVPDASRKNGNISGMGRRLLGSGVARRLPLSGSRQIGTDRGRHVGPAESLP